MLADRHYMREESGRPPMQVSVVLMIALIATFALQCINDVYARTIIEYWLALTPAALTRGYVWQFGTFQFLHGDILHLLCNLLGLWFLGRFVENMIGKRRFLLAYFGSGVIGGLLQCVLMVVFPMHFAPFVYGASAGVMGIFAVFATLESGMEVRWNFLIPIRAGVLLWITAGISLFFTIVPSTRGGGVAHAAHLGGLLAGVLFVKMGWHKDFVPLPGAEFLSRFNRQSPRAGRSRVLARTASGKGAFWKRDQAGTVEDLPSAEFISREVDPILDKISAHGIQSLTDQEKRILEAARARMAKR